MTSASDTSSRDSTTSFLSDVRPLGARHRLVIWIAGTEQVAALPARGAVVVGRTREVDIPIASSAVSRRHARISIGDKSVAIVDLESRNGTRVNGERLSSERCLSYGDVITFGGVTALFEQDAAVERSPSPPGAAEEVRTLDLDGITVVVADAAMRHAYMQLELLAASELSVLVIGETGSGKELATRALRFWSKRREHPLVSINCAALPDGIAESELFGYEKGAFSGAAGSKLGLFESAPGGVVFLDEIGDLSLTVQAKLLRVLENRTICRLGSLQERPIDVRVVSATHRDLMADVAAGTFRQDLYYRLSAGIVQIPPLRARPREIPILARKFLDDAGRELGKVALTLSDAALDLLRAHTWPGNVRELKNLMKYLSAVVERGTVEPDHIVPRLEETAIAPPSAEMPAASATSTSSPDQPQSLDESRRLFERRQIEAALATTGGNKTKAAKALGVPLRTFMDKVRRYGLG